MNVLFIASTAAVTADPPQSRKLFIDALGLPLEGERDITTPAGASLAASTWASGRSRRRPRPALARRSCPPTG